MAKRRPKFTPDHDTIFRLAEEAWALSAEEMESITPGATGVERALSLLDVKAGPDNPLVPRTEYDLLNPHVHLLKVLRDPHFFPFTCRTLFTSPDGSGPLKILPMQHLALKELWWRQFPMLVATRGYGKSFLLAVYALLRATFTPGAKVIVTAAAFRQAKQVFETMERIWHGSPVFRSLVNSGPTKGRNNGPRRDIDRVEFVIGDSLITGLPMGNGEKIRGLRANYILTDEVAAINEEVYAVVVQGFASVTADPVGNVKDSARQRFLKRLGMWSEEMDAQERKRVRGNQSVLSGTADYQFNHFCKYWRDYKAFIESRGDRKKLEEIFKGPVPEDFNYRDYAVIRLPYDLVPHGYMDGKTIARAKQITNSGQFAREYGAVFQLDSEGFFKRSLILRCEVGRPENLFPPEFPSAGGKVVFTAATRGRPDRKYVYGVDPASERDQFAVVVTESGPTTAASSTAGPPRRATTEEAQEEAGRGARLLPLRRPQAPRPDEGFPCERMLVDAGGGGVALREAFRDKDKLREGERPSTRPSTPTRRAQGHRPPARAAHPGAGPVPGHRLGQRGQRGDEEGPRRPGPALPPARLARPGPGRAGRQGRRPGGRPTRTASRCCQGTTRSKRHARNRGPEGRAGHHRRTETGHRARPVGHPRTRRSRGRRPGGCGRTGTAPCSWPTWGPGSWPAPSRGSSTRGPRAGSPPTSPRPTTRRSGASRSGGSSTPGRGGGPSTWAGGPGGTARP
jgi:hypothetical protein